MPLFRRRRPNSSDGTRRLTIGKSCLETMSCLKTPSRKSGPSSSTTPNRRYHEHLPNLAFSSVCRGWGAEILKVREEAASMCRRFLCARVNLSFWRSLCGAVMYAACQFVLTSPATRCDHARGGAGTYPKRAAPEAAPRAATTASMRCPGPTFPERSRRCPRGTRSGCGCRRARPVPP